MMVLAKILSLLTNPESHGLVVVTFDTGVNRVCVHHACMVVCKSAVLVILLIDCSDVLSHGCKT